MSAFTVLQLFSTSKKEEKDLCANSVADSYLLNPAVSELFDLMSQWKCSGVMNSVVEYQNNLRYFQLWECSTWDLIE